MRKAINILQTIYSQKSTIKSSICYNTLAIPNIKIIKKVYELLLDDSNTFQESYKYINKYIIKDGISISLFLKEFFNEVLVNYDNIIKIKGEKINKLYNRYG